MRHVPRIPAAVGSLLFSVVLLVTTTAIAQEQDKCVFAGWKVGGDFPGTLDQSKYGKGSSEFLENLGTKAVVYQLKTDSKENEDFLAIADAKVIAITRQIKVDQVDQYIQALSARFGSPAPPGGPEGSAFGAFVKISYRLTWSVPECNAVFSLVKRTRGVGVLITQSAAVVVKQTTHSGEDLLK